MKVLRTVPTAVRALRRNVTRAILTMLGIVIGIAAVIAMIEIGQGATAALKRSISGMGTNLLIIIPGTASSGGVTWGTGSVVTLTAEDGDAIVKDCPAVAEAAPLVPTNGQVIYGSRNWVPSRIEGTSPSYVSIENWKGFSAGHNFTERDVRNRSKVCLLGQTVKQELFGNESPIGKEIRIKNVGFRVVGVLSPKGANLMGMDQDDVIIAPWTTIRNRVSNSSSSGQSSSSSSSTSGDVNTLSNLYPVSSVNLYPAQSSTQQADYPMPVRFANVNRILVSARTTEEIPDAIQQMTALLRDRHHLQPGQPDDFMIRDLTELLKTMTSTSTLMTNLLLCVALISLLVGGVGIMNIMLVSVTERTREIGLRMAVGARDTDIMTQFLVESILLCLMGGLVGIALGRGISGIVSHALHWPTAISLTAITVSVLVAATIGIVFGFYPAWRAARLDPIEALRYE